MERTEKIFAAVSVTPAFGCYFSYGLSVGDPEEAMRQAVEYSEDGLAAFDIVEVDEETATAILETMGSVPLWIDRKAKRATLAAHGV